MIVYPDPSGNYMTREVLFNDSDYMLNVGFKQ